MYLDFRDRLFISFTMNKEVPSGSIVAGVSLRISDSGNNCMDEMAMREQARLKR